MNYKNVLKILSLIGITVSVIFLLDALIGIIYKEQYENFLLYDGLFFLVNLAVWQWLRNHEFDLKIKESILVVNLLWVLLGVAGAIPLFLYTDISFASSFFEAISGFTTTGATVYTDIEALPHLILFHRSLMHWLGGLGVIVLGVGLLSVINPTGSLSLFKAESTGVVLEKLTPKIKDTALSLWIVYTLLTLVDMMLLKFFGMSWFDAINHAFSTISTGGFSTKNDSLGYFTNDGIIWTTTIFMMLAGINFLAHLKLYYKDAGGYKTEEVKWYFIIFIVLSILLSLVHVDISGDSFYDALKHSSFTIASVMTTTGFATIDYGSWSHLAIAIIFIGLLMGGNAGSTAGGIKIIRHVIIFKTLASELKRILHPNMIISVFIDGVKQKERILSSTFGFFTLFMITVAIVTVYIYARGYDAMTSISGAFAIVGNVGPGFSMVGPADNFSFFSDFDKIFLSVAMIIGRLECYTVFVLLSSSFWKKF
ncbi:TrkH family potassium uptake protein [Sulfurimonas autotrophica]|uniref:Cation transporter n=1 Tax=Sulfurimonas autotrophica (strain ATCC BAA-671 / DSM 16294 / JCM 11897 / OK10) TaxID=563040 RepID=E0USS5_SULAO|nr:TrkH family potassium uptake protein [Sulfurimonas autotrophica]ADN08102.1 cation transporter [Sulfurimonas autotrophica DSM 16294]